MGVVVIVLAGILILLIGFLSKENDRYKSLQAEYNRLQAAYGNSDSMLLSTKDRQERIEEAFNPVVSDEDLSPMGSTPEKFEWTLREFILFGRLTSDERRKFLEYYNLWSEKYIEDFLFAYSRAISIEEKLGRLSGGKIGKSLLGENDEEIIAFLKLEDIKASP